ncbi:MAG TPA: NAD-dependent succinate-semialdehyde dehydrogenase [Thiotrichales bacterium]|nr:NAD-dependent succinate-semialdehyde dehydrogenase [Thiotrichales bacterium]
MSFKVINPASGQQIREVPAWNEAEIETALAQVAAVTPSWAATPMSERCALMHQAGEVLRQNRDRYAAMITQEMGKLIKDARAEVEKCAGVCDFYADHGPEFLADEKLASDASDSYVAHLPLGTVLAVMPWNYPFWQVMRFAAPALVAGNTGLLKHASNVPGSALALEEVFTQAGFPAGVFRSLMIRASQVQKVIEDPRVHAVTLTGSEPAGRQVAATAGSVLKKCVLELGGSDAFIVLEDADLDEAAKWAVASRFLNSGQSCIAAKRFILVDAIAEDFLTRFKAGVEALQAGDPMDEATSFAPMAREDLRDELHVQVSESISAGAVALTGCQPLDRPGAYYAASILDRVEPGVAAYHQELFGPVAIVIRARDEEDALRIANDTPYGLGGSVWTQDSQRGAALARRVESGCTFVNGMVKSDPRLPFGGIKNSGYGRELSRHGIQEFVNAKTIWVK